MGLSNQSDEGRKTYLNIFEGKFAKRVQPGTEGAIERVNKEKKTVHELHYTKLSNVMITGIEKKIKEGFGASWEVTLKEADETFILNLNYSGRQTNGLTHRLPNINFAEPVTLSLFTNDQGKTFLTVYDKTGTKIPAAYTKENPNGLPELEKKKTQGVDKWNDDKQMEFIEQMIETQIQPQLQAASFDPDLEEPTFTRDSNTDDLPFSQG